MKIKVSEAQADILNWLVAKAEGHRVGFVNTARGPKPRIWVMCYDGDDDFPIQDYCGKWESGGPIIEREHIATSTEHGDPWRARFGRARITFDGRAHHYHHMGGPTPLIAAMRCYVSAKLGDEVDVPDELMKES